MHMHTVPCEGVHECTGMQVHQLSTRTILAAVNSMILAVGLIKLTSRLGFKTSLNCTSRLKQAAHNSLHLR